jgi:hypothetical protein
MTHLRRSTQMRKVRTGAKSHEWCCRLIQNMTLTVAFELSKVIGTCYVVARRLRSDANSPGAGWLLSKHHRGPFLKGKADLVRSPAEVAF